MLPLFVHVRCLIKSSNEVSPNSSQFVLVGRRDFVENTTEFYFLSCYDQFSTQMDKKKEENQSFIRDTSFSIISLFRPKKKKKKQYICLGIIKVKAKYTNQYYPNNIYILILIFINTIIIRLHYRMFGFINHPPHKII